MIPMRLRPGRGSRDLGAAAVEFALVVPILLLLVMGILDYGRFFFDSISLRQGAREGARQAVVQQYPGRVLVAGALCDSLSTTGAKIACSTKAASDTTIGTPVVKIPTITAAGGWVQGNQLLVCMQSKEQGTGFVPFPANGILKSKVYMSIEKGTSTDYTYSDAAPATSDWVWCS